MTRDLSWWANAEGIAELRRLRAVAEAAIRLCGPGLALPSSYAYAACDAAPVLAAEVERLQAEAAALRGLLEEARGVGHYEPCLGLIGRECTCGVGGLLARIDAALAPPKEKP